MSVQPPTGSGLAPTTVDTGLMTANTSVTASFGALYSLTGTVASSTGGVLAGQTVTLIPLETQITHVWTRRLAAVKSVSTVTNSAGFYGFNVLTGDYRLQLSGGEANATSEPYRYKIKTRIFHLTVGERLDLTLPIVDLTVTVKNRAGHPLGSVRVSVPCTPTTVRLAANLRASGSSCGLTTAKSDGVANFGLLATSRVSVTVTPMKPYRLTTIRGVSARRTSKLTIVVPG
jgi:hypothetical protein